MGKTTLIHPRVSWSNLSLACNLHFEMGFALVFAVEKTQVISQYYDEHTSIGMQIHGCSDVPLSEDHTCECLKRHFELKDVCNVEPFNREIECLAE